MTPDTYPMLDALYAGAPEPVPVKDTQVKADEMRRRDADMEDMYIRGLTLAEIGSVVGLDPSSVWKVLVARRVRMRPPGARISPRLADRDRDIAQEYEQGATIQQLADAHGLSTTMVHKALVQQGVKRRRRGPGVAT